MLLWLQRELSRETLIKMQSFHTVLSGTNADEKQKMNQRKVERQMAYILLEEFINLHVHDFNTLFVLF